MHKIPIWQQSPSWNSAPFMVPDFWSSRNLASPLRNDTVYTILRVNHGLTQPALVPPLIVLTSALSRSFRRKGQDKVPKTMVWGQIASDYGCLDRFVPDGMIVKTGSFRTGWARFGGDQRSGTINGALLRLGYLLALLNTLHPAHEMYQVRWYGQICFGTGIV